MRWNLAPTVFAVVFLGQSAVSDAQQPANQKELLETIRYFANSICVSPPLEQINDTIELSAEARSRFSGVLSRLIDLGITGAANYKNNKSKGVLQSDLAAAIKNGNDCRLSVFEQLANKFLPLPLQAVATVKTEATNDLPLQFDKPDGFFRKQGSAWIEFPPYSPGKHFLFKDFGSDADYVYLIDGSRTKPKTTNNAMLVRLPINGGAAQWTYQNPMTWRDFTVVMPHQ